jgi:predicted alpha/beta superfamily hydrolase
MTPHDDDLARKRRQRNYMLGAVLGGLVILFYLLTMVRLGAK